MIFKPVLSKWVIGMWAGFIWVMVNIALYLWVSSKAELGTEGLRSIRLGYGAAVCRHFFGTCDGTDTRKNLNSNSKLHFKSAVCISVGRPRRFL
jgi:hypothetical protein